MKVVIGCDPDSDKMGFAVYRNGVLCELLNLNGIQFYKWLIDNEKQSIKNKSIDIHMENPKGNSSSSFNHLPGLSNGAKFKISEKVGMCKQAQSTIEQIAGELDIPVKLHKNSKSWKKGGDKELFKRITKWQGLSNEETRSAAFFGYLGVK